MAEEYDVAVLGLGGMGSQTLLQLAQQNSRVIGIDQFTPPHHYGSSHGLSRLIRMGYFEHPDYVPLIQRAFELWDILQNRTDHSLWVSCGLLEGGPPDGTLVSGLRKAVEQYQLHLPRLSPREVAQRFPGFVLPADWELYFEHQAGFLRPERCIETALRGAQNHGAHIAASSPIRDLEPNDQGVTIRTDHGTYRAQKVIMTLGPWSPLWKTHVDFPIRLLHKKLLWFTTKHSHHSVEGHCPCFLFENEGQFYYGMPAESDVGLKLARHDGGIEIQSVDEIVEATEEIQSVMDFGSRFFSPSLSSVETIVSCRYSMSPDEQFVLGQSPVDNRIHYLAGLSGHGFKFASVLGEVMAGWVLSGDLSPEAEFLHRSRLD
jgi:monomeric sarcosine oxidase